MYLKPNLGGDWRVGALRFLTYMRVERGWRRTWLVTGPLFMCVGVIERFALDDNDNEGSAV
jgi:hypothetical protein